MHRALQLLHHIRAARHRACALHLTFLLLAAAPAAAQTCSGRFSDLNFGIQTLTDGKSVTSTIDLDVNCTGTPGRNLLFCVYAGRAVGSRNLQFGSSLLPYDLYSDAQMTNLWTTQNWSPSIPNSVQMKLDATGTAAVKLRGYGRTQAGNKYLVPGAYYARPGVFYGAAYDATSCSQVPITYNFSSFPDINVRLIVRSSCLVSINPLVFPAGAFLSSPATSASNIRLTCSSGMPVAVSLGLGQSGATNPAARAMRGPSGSLSYGLFQDAAFTIPWGDQAGNDYDIAATPASDINLTVYGRVPAQNVRPGTYTDQIVVTVTY